MIIVSKKKIIKIEEFVRTVAKKLIYVRDMDINIDLLLMDSVLYPVNY